MIRRMLRAIEPWYDSGLLNTTNLDAKIETDVVDGYVWFFQIQWLGLHLGFEIGRTPRALKSPDTPSTSQNESSAR